MLTFRSYICDLSLILGVGAKTLQAITPSASHNIVSITLSPDLHFIHTDPFSRLYSILLISIRENIQEIMGTTALAGKKANKAARIALSYRSQSPNHPSHATENILSTGGQLLAGEAAKSGLESISPPLPEKSAYGQFPGVSGSSRYHRCACSNNSHT